MGKVFVSYRRSDSEGHAGRLFRDLRDRFGAERVLIDVVGMAKGRDFRRTIERRLEESSVLIAVIGRTWVTVQDVDGSRRLDNQNDLVRLETATALRKDMPVIPVLVAGAQMPRPQDLPEDLRDLAFRDGVELTHARWDTDVQHLISALEPIVLEGGLRTARIPDSIRRGLVPVLAGTAVISGGGWAALEVWRTYDEERRRRSEAEARAAEERVRNGRAAEELAAREKAAQVRAAQELAAREIAAKEQAAKEKSVQDRAIEDKLAAERAAADRASNEKARTDAAAAERARADLAQATTLSLARVETAKLDSTASQMRNVQEFQLEVIIVVGHTDSTPDDATSQRASVRRADAVKAYLVSSAVIEKNRVYTVGKGKKMPIASNATAAGRAQNNRAEVEVVGTGAGDGGVRKKWTMSTIVYFR